MSSSLCQAQGPDSPRAAADRGPRQSILLAAHHTRRKKSSKRVGEEGDLRHAQLRRRATSILFGERGSLATLQRRSRRFQNGSWRAYCCCWRPAGFRRGRLGPFLVHGGVGKVARTSTTAVLIRAIWEASARESRTTCRRWERSVPAAPTLCLRSATLALSAASAEGKSPPAKCAHLQIAHTQAFATRHACSRARRQLCCGTQLNSNGR